MHRYMIFKGYGLRIAVGITMLALLLAGGAGAIPVEEWNKTFGGAIADLVYSVQQTSDGGYILAGSTQSYGAGINDAWLIKTDSTGSQQWQKTFGGATTSEAVDFVQQTSDEGYILAGRTSVSGSGDTDGLLIKTDSSGNQQWNKTFGVTTYDFAGMNHDYIKSVQQTSNGGFVLAGGTLSYGAGNYDGWLIKIDQSGNEQWNKTFGGTNSDFFNSFQKTSDGGYILAGYTQSYGAGYADGWIIKTDSSGNQQWNKTFGGTSNDYVNFVKQTSDGGYVLAGTLGDNADGWLIKTDSSGNQQWNKTFGGTASDIINYVQQTSDGGYVLAGYTLSYGAGNADGWLIKTDSSGNQQWNKTFSRTTYDYFYSAQQTSDNGYILAGATTIPDYYDGWLVKVSSDVGNNDPVHNINKGTNYTTIQAAIDDASLGDEVHVDSGTYYENVNVNKQLILKGIDTGVGKPIINAMNNGSAVILSGGNITLEEFVAIGSDWGWDHWSQSGIVINSSSNLVENNIVKGDIYLNYSNSNQLINNSVSDYSYGMILYYSLNNLLIGNNASNNKYNGIKVYYSNNNTLNNNIVLNNTHGIEMTSSGNNTLINNNASRNKDIGIFIGFSSNHNVLQGNNLDSNVRDGIQIGESNYNTLNTNNILNNSFGIEMGYSVNNYIYRNNFVENINGNAYIYQIGGNNLWDNGTEGNYWSDYTGTDSNNDGIGDTPYPIPGGSSGDRYPLMAPYTGEPTIPTPTPGAETFAYITNYYSNTVSEINTATNKVTATVNVGNEPLGIAVNPAGTTVYVTNQGSNNVSVVNTATNTVTAIVPVGIEPIGVAVNPAGTKVYVTNHQSNTVSVIDTATNTVTATVSVGSQPEGVAVNPTGTMVYVANYASNNVSVIEAASNTVAATVNVGFSPRGVAVNPAGTMVYVANMGGNSVSVINTATNTVTSTVPVGITPMGVAVNPVGTMVYVTNYDSNTVSVINTATNTVTATVPVGLEPWGVAVNPTGTMVYVANANSNTVSVIDAESNTITSTVPVGSRPVSFGQFIGHATATPTPIPNQPTDINQLKSDGITPIAVNSATNERTVIFKGRVSDPDGDNVKLQIELRRTDEYGGEFNESKGGLKESELVPNGSIATASAIELINGNYHWRARTIDENGNKSEWNDFGENPTFSDDFRVYTEFRFVQLTDTHLGPNPDCYWNEDENERDDCLLKTWTNSYEAFDAAIDNIKELNPRPDFILLTGDIVEWNNKVQYKIYDLVRNQFGTIPVYSVPGNHDRRGSDNPVYFLGPLPILGTTKPSNNLDNYEKYIGSKGADDVNGDYTHGDKYYFDKFGYRFIGLDSGYDSDTGRDKECEPDWADNPYVTEIESCFKPKGTGLSQEQIQYLKDNAVNGKTIVFMHHPTNDTDNNYNVISKNREQFIKAELDSGVELTLTGHTHYFRRFINQKEGWTPYLLRNLLVQTRSATKNDPANDVIPGYLVVDVGRAKYGQIELRTVNMVGSEPGVKFSIYSPANLHVYDQFGRHTGLNATGGIENQIPNSYYISGAKIGNITLPESVLLFNRTLNYSSEIVSNFSKENITGEQSHFNFTIEERTGGTIKTTSYNNVTIEENSRAYIEVNGSQLNYSMQVDLNNDGTNETVKAPDTVIIDYSPLATITSPANGSEWDQGQAITFSGTGYDPEDGVLNELSWISDRDDTIGHGNFVTSNLSAGMHSITVQVNDSIGQVNTSTIVLTVIDTMPPSLEIDYPSENKTFNNPNINVRGIAYDDSGISNVTVNGIQAGKESWNASLGLSEGENTIEVVATDNKGFSKTANRTVYYNSSLASDTQPTAAITNLTHETGYDSITGAWINWTWDNPEDQDFSYAIIYLDNIPMGNTSRSYFNFTGLSNDADYNISILTADIVDNINYSEVKDTARTLFLDTTPPASVQNLVNVSYAQNYINWTWTEPIDPDFTKVMVYLDGVYKNDVLKGVQYYNATVTPGTYTIGTRTVDTNGTMNATMITHTATTILPPVRFINGTVIDSVNKTGISGVTVSANSTLSTATNLSGFYSFAVTSGTYNLTAKFEPTYYVKNTIMVSTVLSAVVVQDIELVRKPTGNITGSVTKV